MSIRIANAAGFLGDQLGAPQQLVESAEVEYLTLEYLAELTLSILARQREKDPMAGYARDFIDVLQTLAPAVYLQPQLSIITNAGGMNPRACAAAAGHVLTENGSPGLEIASVQGDDLLDRLEELLAAGHTLEHMETGQPLSELKRPVVSMNAYLGAQPIAQAVAGGARLVITGRVADASLTVGPAAHEFGWNWNDWHRLAGASVAGHLIECGAQVTGGYTTDWESMPLATIGYPIAEIAADANSIITKASSAPGCVNRMRVVEQLVYEIDDPAAYLTPDVVVDFTRVFVADQGNNRVAIRGGRGRPAPDTYKVSLAYHDGFTCSGQLLVYGRDCIAKARACAEIVFARLKRAGYEFDGQNVELLGAGDGVPGLHKPLRSQREVVLRITVNDTRRQAVERFSREIAPLITSGPAGLAGYAAGHSAVRPVYAFWPTLVPKAVVEATVEIKPASRWAELYH